MFKEFELQKYKKDLNALSSVVLRAYLDSAIFIRIVEFANNKRRANNFLFDYSYYSIREKAIIATKSIIEPTGKNKLTINKIIKELQQSEEYKQFADGLYIKYTELLESKEAKRVKAFRDSLCHNIEDDTVIMVYCGDIMYIIDSVMKILDRIYQHVFNIQNEDFYKIQYLSVILADNYWTAICDQADRMPTLDNELRELQRIFNCSKEPNYPH
jgi:hypothetical protein